MKEDIIEELYQDKADEYFSLERDVILKQIKGSNINILDVGCGSGELGNRLKKQNNVQVYGIEINKKAFKKAEQKLDKVYHGNIETMHMPFEKETFDYIILGDVLEHLINPKTILKKLFTYLNNSGSIIITVPNVKYWRTTKSLIFKDEWEYQDWGILDFTHLRFFTKKSLINLTRKLGFHNTKSKWVIGPKSKSYYINKLTFKIIESFLASHILLIIRK